MNRTSIEQRFWAKVEKTDTCWLWIGSRDGRGYGRLRLPGETGGLLSAHRYSAMLHFGMFDKRLFVLHTCDTPACVRPDHLFLGTHQDNMDDMRKKGRGHLGNQNTAKTHCPHGHSYDDALIWSGKRNCRTCNRARLARRKYVG